MIKELCPENNYSWMPPGLKPKGIFLKYPKLGLELKTHLLLQKYILLTQNQKAAQIKRKSDWKFPKTNKPKVKTWSK